MRRSTPLLLLASLLLVAPSVSRAQDEPEPIYGGCNLDVYLMAGCGSGGYHGVNHAGLGQGNDHGTTCYYCTTGYASDCHPWCGDNMDAATKLAYQRAIDAAKAGKAEDLIALRHELAGYLVFNASRQSVQLKACNHTTLLANIPVSGRELRLAMLLPTDRAPSRRVLVSSR